ncbi:MAG: GvpL/GvpF family gas vesicle protein [Kaiparowitsia implicata GSE-PSE-MK54-09C]|jgi:hypothetical protein|nr:GvpL/GvpF family gas vesicle protein [Kaiparowitsia implicata GSE-PSE-MK54-09C]
MTNPLYLYGIFPKPGPQQIDLAGLDDQPVQAQDLDGFIFLYSEAASLKADEEKTPDGKPKKKKVYLASRRNLMRHERVLESAMEQGCRTLLPLQFGLVIEDWQLVRSQLTQPQGDALKTLFSKLEGHREVSVKLFWDQPQELQQLMQENTDLRAERDRLEGKTLSMDEIVKIGQSVEQAMGDRQQHILNAFRTTLNPLATEVVENAPMSPEMIFNTAYLIPWNDEAAFGQHVEALDAQFESRLKIRYNNFTAPFNFAQLQ